MFFEIINCSPKSFSGNLQKIKALSNLLITSHERKNIVVADRVAMNEVLGLPEYGMPQKVSAQELIELDGELRPLSKSLSISAVVDFNKASNECVYDAASNKLVFGYNFFCDTANVQGVNLVAENSSDCEFYKQIVRLYASLPGQLGVNFRPVSGSGSQSKVEFDKLVSSNSLVLCIIDSDQKHPRGGKGGTASQFAKTDFEIGCGHFVVMLDGRRELENMVPISFYRDVAAKMQGSKIDAFDEIKRLADLNYDFYRYFDFKEGMYVADIVSLDREFGDFWSSLLQSNKSFSKHRCFKSMDEKGCKSCPKVEGFGDKVVGHVLPLLEKANRHYVEKNTDELLYSELKSMADLLLGWGCSLDFKPSRS